MVMDDTEIINSFKQAKDKKNQVQVLADLNGISKKEMQEHLKTLGLEVPPLRGAPGRTRQARGRLCPPWRPCWATSAGNTRMQKSVLAAGRSTP